MRTTTLLTGMMALSAAPALAGSLVIDDFTGAPEAMIGASRDLDASFLADPFAQSGEFYLDEAMSIGGDIGALFFNSGIGAQQTASLSYNNNGTGLDFDAIGMQLQAFELDIAAADQGFSLNIVLSTFDAMGDVIGDARLAVFVPAGLDQTAIWNYADFADITGSFDASNIDDITINFNLEDNATPSLDFVATEFRANVVPAPGAIALLGLGGLASVRRRR